MILAAAACAAQAQSDEYIDMLEPGGGAFAYTWRQQSSPYRDARTPSRSLDPHYFYEGDYAYLHSTRAGLKADVGIWRFDAFVAERLEGYTADTRPKGNEGAPREPGFDIGVSARLKMEWGKPYLEVRQDASHRSHGTEARLGAWGNTWTRGYLHVRPHAALAYRNDRLNQYYYDADGGMDVELGLYAEYDLPRSWRVLASVTGIRHSGPIASSVLVDQGTEIAATLGILYDFSPNTRRWEPGSRPLVIRALYGNSSDCDVGRIVQSKCTSRHTVDETDIWGIDIGRPLIRQPNGKPVEITAFLGAQRHIERGNQSDFWEYKAYLKAYYWGFPWDRLVRTRFGIGAGLSYTEQIPVMEERDQAKSNAGTWKLLNYLDPTIDIRLTDLIPTPPLRDTWFGVGVAHRSGMFGWSRQFGYVDGGSNYIYVYLESNF
ncbi:MAG: MipA family protein [Betaproteobacteria bacterium]|nr:MipA family protein [Betaproteobacteria bacterium]